MNEEKDKTGLAAADVQRRFPAAGGTGSEELRMGHLFLATLFEGIQEEIMVVDAAFVIQDVNRRFLKRLGLPKEKVIGRRCYEVASETGTSCTCRTELCPLERASATGERVEFVDRVAGSRKGQMREIVHLMYPVGDEGGSPRYFVEISRDETARRQLVNRIKASEKKFRLILDTAKDAIVSVDGEQRIILFNDAARRMFGCSRRDALGMPFHRLVPHQNSSDYRELQRFFTARRKKALGHPLSLLALRQGGGPFPIEMGVSFQLIDKEQTFTAIIRDVSERQQLEGKLLQNERLAAVGRAVAQVAHEIKNPLMVIGGFSQQIRKGLTDQKAQQKLEVIFNEIGRLERLVADLGDFAKQHRLVKRPADINAVLREVVSAMGALHPPEKYRLHMEFEEEKLEIRCDPDKLKQVFMNVITNGLQAMEAGGVMTIATNRTDDTVEVRIRDEGKGITEEDLKRIFDPFFTTRQEGSGLGLSISFKLVEAHCGEITAASAPGEGTTFMIRLPV